MRTYSTDYEAQATDNRQRAASKFFLVAATSDLRLAAMSVSSHRNGTRVGRPKGPRGRYSRLRRRPASHWPMAQHLNLKL